MTAHTAIETPTAHLRLVIRDGQTVLQQFWKCQYYDGKACPDRYVQEWRDVPIVPETPNLRARQMEDAQ